MLKKIFKIGMYLFGCIVKINNKKITFISFSGKSYSDNPKYISETLHKMAPDFKLYWVFINPSDKDTIVPPYVKKVKFNSLHYFYTLVTSKVWIDNFAKPWFYYKKKRQFYIQTWHGDRSFKRIMYDVWDEGKRPERIFDEFQCDFITTGSLFAEKMYRTALNYKGEYFKHGSARNDYLLNYSNTDLNRIKMMLNIPFDTRILLYAPTLRQKYAINNGIQEMTSIDLEGVIKTLNSKTHENWVLLVRAHSAMAGISLATENYIDVSYYEDMTELLIISDILITDYSSAATDYILTNKPVILFQDDIDIYLDKDRKFYYDIKQSGFNVVYSNQELLDFIEKQNIFDNSEINERIRKFYGTYETGRASILISTDIINLIRGEKK